MLDLSFYRNKRVMITGHTGFKGSWMCRILVDAGAQVSGYALEPSTQPNLFTLSGLADEMNSVIGDIRDRETMRSFFESVRPEIVIHMAAQPIVRYGYRHPVETYETNVMGTVNLLECVRECKSVQSVVNITTDKVYRNNEWCWGYRETDPLDGYDPYSNSKSCSELVTHCYKNSFFASGMPAISTVRAGNVIGGGDFAQDRIIPDCIRAQIRGEKIGVRNPHSVRPYQHVLEPISVYLMIAQKQAEDPQYANWYNIGPDDQDCIMTGELVDLFCRTWGEQAKWENLSEVGAPHEANFLKLDCSLLKTVFHWKPVWHIDQAVEETCRWSKIWMHGGDIRQEMRCEIQRYLTQMKQNALDARERE